MLGSSRPELGRKPEGEVPTRTWASGGPPGGSQAARGCAVSQHVCIGNIGVHRGSVCVQRKCVHLHCVCMFCQVSVLPEVLAQAQTCFWVSSEDTRPYCDPHDRKKRYWVWLLGLSPAKGFPLG